MIVDKIPERPDVSSYKPLIIDTAYSLSLALDGNSILGSFNDVFSNFIETQHFGIIPGIFLRDMILDTGILGSDARIKSVSIRKPITINDKIIITKPTDNKIVITDEYMETVAEYSIIKKDTESKDYNPNGNSLLFKISELIENLDFLKKFPHGKEWKGRNSHATPTDSIFHFNPSSIIELNMSSAVIEWLGFQLGNILLNHKEKLYEKSGKLKASGILDKESFIPRFTTIEERYISPYFLNSIHSEELAISVSNIGVMGGAFIAVSFSLDDLSRNRTLGEYKFILVLG